MQPWIKQDLDINDYHSGSGLSSSGIRLLLKCPKRFWYEYLSGNFKRKETPDFLFGSAVHTAILEPGKNLLFEYPKLKKDKLSDIRLILDNVHELPIAERLGQGNIEHSLFWESEDVILKTRPDFFDEQCVIEIKTTRDASKDKFARSIVDYGYHVQAAMQLDGIEAALGFKPSYFIFIAIEKDAPFIASAYLLGETDIEQGRRLYKKGVEIFKTCIKNNAWGGYSDQLEEIKLPLWALDEDLRETSNV